MPRILIATTCAALLAACTPASLANTTNVETASTTAATPDPTHAVASQEVARLDEPWAMAFLPDGRLLVTERRGALKIIDTATGQASDITGVPDVVYGGQGGLGDVVLHPQFADNQRIYLSYAEAGPGNTAGGAIAHATLNLNADGTGHLSDRNVIWRQVPKVTGRGHYAHRMAFDADGLLWVTSGERQKFDPSQDMQSNLGKVLRLHDDGSPVADNPFADQGGVAAEVWSLGHRNPLGMAFDGEGRLWVHEMGPRGGDELNLIERGSNYGYPVVSEGNHYDGRRIPDHATRPEFIPPVISWTPVISPSSMVIYAGEQFPHWQGHALIGGLSSQGLVRVQLDGPQATEVERLDLGERIRAVAEGPDSAMWVLEDGRRARLLKLTPAGN